MSETANLLEPILVDCPYVPFRIASSMSVDQLNLLSQQNLILHGTINSSLKIQKLPSQLKPENVGMLF